MLFRSLTKLADHNLAGREVGFLELRLLANGILESNKLALGQGNQERLEDDNGLSQAGIQIVVVPVHLSPHSLGIQRGSFGEVIGGKAKLLPKILDHFLQSADFMKELQPSGKQHVAEQAAHARRPLASLSLKIRGIERRSVGHDSIMLGGPPCGKPVFFHQATTRQSSLTHLPRARGRLQSVTPVSVVKRSGSVAKKTWQRFVHQAASVGSSVAKARISVVASNDTTTRIFTRISHFLLNPRARRYTSGAIAFERIFDLQFEPRDQLEQRQKKLAQIQALGHDPYPREFRWTDTPAALVDKYTQTPGVELEATKSEVRVAGRIVSLRLMGKAGFAHLQGAGKRIQIYVKKDVVGEQGFQLFHLLDLGDSIGVRGHLFRTKTNELSIWVEEIFFLSKALLPLPEKWHGLTDVELRYRQRYLDLIANEKSREVFVTRARIIQELRRFFDARGYIEVETPMMHPIAGGAAARPFTTHHNTLDIDLYLRVAPELYLKRLTVGGFDRVFEINRNFRNEGISTQHNPEFTMLEFYEAYSNYRDLMDMNEQLFALLAKNITGSTTVNYGGAELDFSFNVTAAIKVASAWRPGAFWSTSRNRASAFWT